MDICQIKYCGDNYTLSYLDIFGIFIISDSEGPIPFKSSPLYDIINLWQINNMGLTFQEFLDKLAT